MKRNIRNNSREKQLHESVVQYISLQYPTIWFQSDRSGAKMEGSLAISTHSLSKKKSETIAFALMLALIKYPERDLNPHAQKSTGF